MAQTSKVFNTPGCKPGTDQAITQAKSIAMGYAMLPTPRRVKLNQKSTETGKGMAPGLTSRK